MIVSRSELVSASTLVIRQQPDLESGAEGVVVDSNLTTSGGTAMS